MWCEKKLFETTLAKLFNTKFWIGSGKVNIKLIKRSKIKLMEKFNIDLMRLFDRALQAENYLNKSLPIVMLCLA